MSAERRKKERKGNTFWLCTEEMTCHLEIGKKRRRKKQLQQGDFRKKYKEEVLLYIQRERRHKKRPEERGYELAGYLALQLHARETLLEHKGRMADGEQPAVLHPNASLLPYELFQPRCLHRLLEEQQKKKRL